MIVDIVSFLRSKDTHQSSVNALASSDTLSLSVKFECVNLSTFDLTNILIWLIIK